jgi:hypothetical protein
MDKTELLIQVLASFGASVIALFFAGMSALHRYWALGGKRGRNVVVPIVDGKPWFPLNPLTCMALVVVYLIFAAIVMGRVGLLGGVFPAPVFYWLNWLLVLTFIGRAVGDFNRFGFFKKASDTDFAYWDTRLFCPGSLVIAFFVALIGLS